MKILIGLLGLVLVALAGIAWETANNSSAIKELRVDVRQKAPPGTARVSRTTWPSLNQDQTIALGEAVKTIASEGKVVIFCANSDCHDFMTDLDDAFQIAGWTSEFERRYVVPPEDDSGLMVGPKENPAARKLAETITKTTGISVRMIDTASDGPLAVMIGQRRR